MYCLQACIQRKLEEKRLRAQDQRAREVQVPREHREGLKRLYETQQTAMERNFWQQRRKNMVRGGREIYCNIDKQDGSNSVRVDL